MTRPLLSATMIVRDEKPSIRQALGSIVDHVDEIVIVDTGSKDGTLAEARRFLQERKQAGKLKTARFKWVDDFAAARQAADDLATGEWLVWLDADDTVTGLEQLRRMAADASDDVVAFFVRYAYAVDQDQNAISELWRERVVRNDGIRWEGRLHEHKLFTQGQVVQVDPQVAEWVHHRDHSQRTGERNLRILDQWLEQEPENARVISSIAMEYMGAERYADASGMFARYLECPGEPPDRRAQASRHMCVMLMVQGRAGEARAAALASLQEMWLWPDTHLTLAEVAQTAGRPDEALAHARTAMDLGKPSTLLIINPLQYTAHPLAISAICLAQMGRFEEAVQTAERALQIAPHYPLAVEHLPMIRAQLKRARTVGSVLASVEVLVETGELLKARVLVDQAPFYVFDDPRLVARRSELARLITERLGAPEVAVVDAAADAFVERMSEAA